MSFDTPSHKTEGTSFLTRKELRNWTARVSSRHRETLKNGSHIQKQSPSKRPNSHSSAKQGTKLGKELGRHAHISTKANFSLAYPLGQIWALPKQREFIDNRVPPRLQKDIINDARYRIVCYPLIVFIQIEKILSIFSFTFL